MRDGKIHLQDSDDDAGHLCHPVSFQSGSTPAAISGALQPVWIGMAHAVERVVSHTCQANALVFCKPIRA